MVAFEEIFLTEQLAHCFERPMYLGTTNYMARWAYAPLYSPLPPALRCQHPGADQNKLRIDLPHKRPISL